MPQKKSAFGSDTLSLPVLQLLFGEARFPESEHPLGRAKGPKKPGPEMEGTVRKLIAHLQDDQK
jgi:hypothetical protein